MASIRFVVTFGAIGKQHVFSVIPAVILNLSLFFCVSNLLVEKEFLFNVEYFRTNLAGPIFVIFIVIERKYAELFKRFELNFVVTVSELVHFENCVKFW